MLRYLDADWSCFRKQPIEDSWKIQTEWIIDFFLELSLVCEVWYLVEMLRSRQEICRSYHSLQSPSRTTNSSSAHHWAAHWSGRSTCFTERQLNVLPSQFILSVKHLDHLSRCSSRSSAYILSDIATLCWFCNDKIYSSSHSTAWPATWAPSLPQFILPVILTCSAIPPNDPNPV